MVPSFREKCQRLQQLYREFEEAVGPHTSGAVCRPGCSDCCTNVGTVDATTLEGWIILNHLQNLPASVQKEYAKKLKNNRKDKSTSKFARCAFLRKDQTCGIYSVRPFSCRRLYSVAVCGETGPTVHRGVWQIAQQTASAIQALDDTGYSGHISFILAVLKDSKFRSVYLDGGFDPGAIESYAREHSISINRFLAARS